MNGRHLYWPKAETRLAAPTELLLLRDAPAADCHEEMRSLEIAREHNAPKLAKASMRWIDGPESGNPWDCDY